MKSPSGSHWLTYQPGFKFTSEPPGSPAFFDAVEAHRYDLESHIPGIAEFDRWTGKDVLDVGCGVATDGIRFARAGALYTGLDGSETAVDLARRRFDLEGVRGTIVHGQATELPFDDASFDLVWSHGVIHHFPATEKAVAEMHRVLRPGGTALVMLYHRTSFNYVFTILLVRRALAGVLLLPGAGAALSRLTGEASTTMEGHRALLKQHGLRYLTDRQLFLSNNTDGPGNPLSKVYDARQARRLFARFESVETDVRFLNLRIYPKGARIAKTRVAERLGRRWGWHLYVRATR